ILAQIPTELLTYYQSNIVDATSSELNQQMIYIGIFILVFVLLIMVPQTVLGLFAADYSDASWYQVLSTIFNLDEPAGIAIYAVVIILFTFFYAHIQINPERAAENLQKAGGYIPSIRPGLATKEYLQKMLNRLSTVGSLFLMSVAVLPLLGAYFFDMPKSIALGGTSLLIVVGVALDTAKQIEGRTIKRNYVGFIQDKKN
ncbi:MAG: preprotein translocase subunit SecY, partial [Aerococcus viridans]